MRVEWYLGWREALTPDDFGGLSGLEGCEDLSRKYIEVTCRMLFLTELSWKGSQLKFVAP